MRPFFPMTIKLKTAATAEPVTAEEFFAHARITPATAADSADVEQKLKAARLHVERNVLNRALITSTWTLYLPDWPCRSYIEIPLGNLQSVASVKYTDSAGVVHTWASTNYKLIRTYSGTSGDDTDAGFGRLVLACNCTWPTETLDTGEPIAIEFTCGWKDAVSVPADLKTAVEMCASDMNLRRESEVIGGNSAVSVRVARSVESLCSPYADVKF